jgi:TIR domain
MFGADASAYHSCFISFSTKDHRFAEKLYADLQASGVRCWFAPHDLDIGATTADEIDRQISRLDKLIIVLSKPSLKSQWVEDEVLKAYAEERRRSRRVLLPVRLDDTVMRTREAWALKLRDQRNIGDFKRWRSPTVYRQAFDRLLGSLRREQSV